MNTDTNTGQVNEWETDNQAIRNGTAEQMTKIFEQMNCWKMMENCTRQIQCYIILLEISPQQGTLIGYFKVTWHLIMNLPSWVGNIKRVTVHFSSKVNLSLLLQLGLINFQLKISSYITNQLKTGPLGIGQFCFQESWSEFPEVQNQRVPIANLWINYFRNESW